MNPPTNDILPQGYKITELGPLPEEWEVVKLGEVADVIMGQSPPGSSYNEKGEGLPFLQGKAEFGSIHPKHIKYTTAPMKIAPKNSVLLSVRAPVGDVNIADIEYCIGRGLSSLSLENGNNIFLFYILSYLKGELEKEGTGSIFKAITKTKLMNFVIPLPPLPEQQKIAAVFTAVQEAKEKTQAVIDATKVLKKSMMKHLFTYGPVPTEEAANVPLKETEIGKVPEEWEVVKLGEIFDIQQGKQLSAKESKEGKIKKPFLRTSNLNWGHIDISSVDEMYFTLEELKKLKLESGDILVCEGGDIGRTALYRGELAECAYQNHLHRLRPKKNNVDVECFVFWMNHAINQKKMYTHSANRTTIPNLSSSRLKEFIFPLPPLPIQQKIASILSAIDAKIEAEENKKQALEDLFKTLLYNLMTAKIRVTAINELP
jgi:type I restriction enzyme S subunit